MSNKPKLPEKIEPDDMTTMDDVTRELVAKFNQLLEYLDELNKT